MAAPFQNYSGGVLLADIVKRNNLSTYVSEAIKERSAFLKSETVLLAALISQLLQPQFHVVAGDHHHDLAALRSFEAQLRFRRLPAALGRTVHGLRTRLKYDRLVLGLYGPLPRTITPSLR